MMTVTRYGTLDLERAKNFYDAVTALVGAQRVLDLPEVVGYQGNQGAMFLIGTPYEGTATFGNGTQLSFPATSRASVDQVYGKARELGGKCEGPPALRPNGAYAAYFRDPDGNKLMVFHRSA
jgi:predicted lactoylglutathione lyase